MTNTASNGPIDTVLKQLIRLFESKGFSQIKAAYKGSPYGDPKAIFGHTPKLTCFDSNNKFTLLDLCSQAQLDDAIKERWAAFSKYADLHKAHFWLFCPKGAELKVTRYIKEANLTDKIHAIKFMPGL